jgi:hypothetical protein
MAVSMVAGPEGRQPAAVFYSLGYTTMYRPTFHSEPKNINFGIKWN